MKKTEQALIKTDKEDNLIAFLEPTKSGKKSKNLCKTCKNHNKKCPFYKDNLNNLIYGVELCMDYKDLRR